MRLITDDIVRSRNGLSALMKEVSVVGSSSPCGNPAAGDVLAFRNLPLTLTVVLYAKLFKILPYPGLIQHRAPFLLGHPHRN